MATECSWNDGSKTQYYYVILDRLPGCSRGLERAPEWHVRGPLTTPLSQHRYASSPSSTLFGGFSSTGTGVELLPDGCSSGRVAWLGLGTVRGQPIVA